MAKPRKPDEELKIEWSKAEQDFVVHYPRKSDGGYLLNALFGKRLGIGIGDDHGRPIVGHYTGLPKMTIIEEVGLKEELEARGYDLSTLKISIKKKKSTQV